MGSDTVGAKDAGKLLHDLYGPKEKDYWHMPVNDLFVDIIGGPFSINKIRNDVQRLLKDKAREYSYCQKWVTEFLR